MIHKKTKILMIHSDELRDSQFSTILPGRCLSPVFRRNFFRIYSVNRRSRELSVSFCGLSFGLISFFGFLKSPADF